MTSNCLCIHVEHILYTSLIAYLIMIHWFTQAIEGYRETEKAQWREENMAVVQRLKVIAETVTEGREVRALDEVHVLDLAKDG